MRMNKGHPFIDVHEEAPLPDVEEIEADAERARAEGFEMRVFSEMFLYPRLGKGDARFVLGVADEYEHVITALGPAAVRALLDVQPRLVQRLGTGEKLIEWLEDARSDRGRDFDERFPQQVILDRAAAESVWSILHEQYARHFEPENTLDKDTLRAYHFLTDALGSGQQEARKAEQDRLPEKLKKRDERRREIDQKRERRRRGEGVIVLTVTGKNDLDRETIDVAMQGLIQDARDTFDVEAAEFDGEPIEVPER